MSQQTEKIARMVGKTTYKDFREGFGGTSLQGDSDADIKGALGMAQRATSSLAVQVLETRYASTLKHERVIRRAWDRHRREAARTGGLCRDKRAIVTERLVAALAIRFIAGAKMSKPDIEEWAWLLCMDQGAMDDEVRRCVAWLDELCTEAQRAFLVALGTRKAA